MNTLSCHLSEVLPKKYRVFNDFDMQTEVELACVFKRIPRKRPYADEIPFYPYLPPHGHSPPYRVNFNLGYNPFAIN